jgi:actin-related protein 2
MVGDETSKYRSMLEMTYPTSEAVVQNWEDYKLLLDYSFKKIGCASTRGRDIFMTEAVNNPTGNREKLLELLFEEFQFGRVQVGIQALLSIFAVAETSGMLVDSGDGVTHCIPVQDMYVLKNHVERLNIAGSNITKFLGKLMLRRGYAFNSTADYELIREVKEKMCMVSPDFLVDRQLAQQTTCFEKTFTLPDRSTIRLGPERFEAPEILFNPMIDGQELPGCAEMIFASINHCDVDCRKMLYGNIILSGGTTILPGFPTRLANDIRKYYREKVLKGGSDIKIKINVNDSPTRKYSVFQGAAFVAETTQPKDHIWVLKRQWDEKGARIVH